ncbi:MAG: GlsB/YeaQ/YmgE family stress response membrane protein [Hyphomicrobiaceae bacterium]
MDAASLVVMLIVGAVAGWLASLVVGGLKWGLLGYIVAGIIGGVVGGWLLQVAKVNINLGHPMANSIAISAIGAIVVIVLARLLG